MRLLLTFRQLFFRFFLTPDSIRTVSLLDLHNPKSKERPLPPKFRKMAYLFKGLSEADEKFDGSDLRILIVHAR
jgi:hypothetical protein